MVAEPAHFERRHPALLGAHWLMAAAATLSAAALAVVLAVVFAATLAVITVVVAAALAVWAVAFRLSRRTVQRVPAGAVTLEARKVGHAWVAYGWDQGAR
jgi:Flp pilus assembly protein TadB